MDHATNIPGLKRIAFIRRPGFVDPSPPLRKVLFEDAGIDESCWCYEGLVIPGGGLRVGRWMNAIGAMGNGDGPARDLVSGLWVSWRDWSV